MHPHNIPGTETLHQHSLTGLAKTALDADCDPCGPRALKAENIEFIDREA